MGRQYSVQMPPATLSASVTKSVILLNPAVASLTVVEFGISFDNVTSNAEPIQVDAYRVSTIGSPAGNSYTPQPLDEAFEASVNSALTNLTVEPSAVNIIATWYVQPNSGLLVIQWPLGREILRTKAAGARVGFRVTTVAGVTPKCAAYTLHEE